MDPIKSVSAQPATTPAGTGAVEGAASEVEQGKQTGTAYPPELLTEFERRMEDVLQRFTRTEQSQRDKMEARFKAELGRNLANLQAAGLTVSDSQRSALAGRIRSQVQEEFSAETSKPEGRPSPKEEGEKQEPEQEVDGFNAVAYQIMQDEGMDLEEGDPELDMVDTSSMKTFRRTVLAAIDAKQVRLAKASTPLAGGAGPQSQDALYEELERLSRAPTLHKVRLKELRKLLGMT